MNQPSLSPILPSEAKLLAEQLVNMAPWLELGYQTNTLRHYLLATPAGFQGWGLHIDGVLAGVITTRSPWLRGTLLELLAILPNFQKQGWGAWLMQWLMTHAQSNSQRNLWTLVSAFNKPAIDFYHAQGFTTIGQLDNFIVEGQHELLLRLAIAESPLTPPLRQQTG